MTMRVLAMSIESRKALRISKEEEYSEVVGVEVVEISEETGVVVISAAVGAATSEVDAVNTVEAEEVVVTIEAEKCAAVAEVTLVVNSEVIAEISAVVEEATNEVAEATSAAQTVSEEAAATGGRTEAVWTLKTVLVQDLQETIEMMVQITMEEWVEEEDL